MKIGEMYQKEIDRPIQGVVKIGQDSNELITTELDEYVVTKELYRHFDKFFSVYRKGTKTRTDKMGVWISGFFGSGKSHFLKILSYLLGCNVYDNRQAISYFEGKIKNPTIMADMQLALDTSADVILFNIDAEADSDSKTNKDPIVKVFMKVFNKMQGFCGSMPWIADLERQMVKDGSYDDFRSNFKEISNIEWEDAREDFYFEQDNIVKALADSTRMSEDAALAWYNKSEENYSLDINLFARRVREYIEMKQNQIGKKHFVIFLCDEVGQYIGSSQSLMLNLQNIVEALGTECGGQSWVICTGQEDIDSIVSVSRDAFSKIIGRFDTRLSLSSANVDEVIKIRLLAKKDNPSDRLRLLYSEKSAIIKNLITFSQDTPEKRLYDTEDDFINIYPFIPYQIKLLQAVFNGIREHGASGKHLSEGERSLLSAFQEAAIQYADAEIGMIIPFDAFYNTVETFLDHNIRKVIIDAEDSAQRESGVLEKDDVAVLKVLFMLKYINNVLPANLENITTVMLNHIDQDKIETKKKIDASLRRLESQKLISKNGEIYIFLTNDEQDINREIREIRISQSEIIDKIGSEIFNILFGLDKKYRYDNTHDFGFNTTIDDRPIGAHREEIGVRVLTPYFALGGVDDIEIKGLSLREHNILVALTSDSGFLNEMEQAMQIDTFLRRNTAKTMSENADIIKAVKQKEYKDRTDRCRDLITETLKKAPMYVNGNKLDIKEKPPTQRINEAFSILIESIYTKLNYITANYLTVESLREILTSKNNQIKMDGVETAPNHLAITEMLDIIDDFNKRNVATTIRSLITLFNKIPYGWKDLDIAGVLLTLFKEQQIRLELNGENIPTNDLEVINYVTKRDFQDRVVIKKREIISPALITNAKNISIEVFNRSDVPNDEDGLMSRIKSFALSELNNSDGGINELLHNYKHQNYPGKRILENGKKLLEQLERIKDIKAFFEYLQTEKEVFIDYSEDVQDVKKFFRNQRDIFDNALKMIFIFDNNRSYVRDDEIIELVKSIEAIIKQDEPYTSIKDLPELIEKFGNRFTHLLEEECKPIRKNIESDREITLSDLNQRTFKDKFANKVVNDYTDLLTRLSRVNNIYEAFGIQKESENYKEDFIKSFNAEEERIAKESAVSEGIPDYEVKVRKTKTISVKTLFAGTRQIANKQDIDDFLNGLRTKLETELEEDTTIQII